MVEFKVKDRVRRIKSDYAGMVVGNVGTVIDVNLQGHIRIKEYDDGTGQQFHSKQYFVLAINKKPTYIIVYDLEDGDPVKLAYSLPEAKEIAKKLIKQEDVIEKSVVIYEIKKIIKPKLSVRFR